MVILDSRRRHYAARVSIFLIMVALIAGMVGCIGGDGDDYNPLPSQNLEIRDWYDLDEVRNNLAGNHTLMNDLDSTTAGYEELASPTANGGKGWQPIGTFTGIFYGQGYEIRDLFINRPDDFEVGLFGAVGQEGVVENIGVVNVTVTGDEWVGGLTGRNKGTVSNSYSSGSVTGYASVGGLVGQNYGTVSNSHSSGSVSSTYSAGGLVGYNFFGTVSDSYSTGSVTGNSSVGGLVGDNAEEGSVSNSLWDTETSGQATSDGGTGKTTAQMQDVTTFSEAGWNITAVDNPSTRNSSYTWNIVNGLTYPFLSWEP